jgi:hypothetical protein
MVSRTIAVHAQIRRASRQPMGNGIAPRSLMNASAVLEVTTRRVRCVWPCLGPSCATTCVIAGCGGVWEDVRSRTRAAGGALRVKRSFGRWLVGLCI